MYAPCRTGSGDHSCKSNGTLVLGFLIRAGPFRHYPSLLFCSRFQMATPKKTLESKLEGNRWKSWEIQLLKVYHIFFLSLSLSSAMVGSNWSPLCTVNCKTFVKIINEVRKKVGEMKETGETLWQFTYHKSSQFISKQKPFTNFLNQISNCWWSCFMIIKQNLEGHLC